MKKIIIYAVVAFLLSTAAHARGFEVELAGDSISINANQVPLQDILRRLVDQGIKVRIDPRINPHVTASFENREVQSGLDSILKSTNHILIWRSVEGPLVSYERLEEIHVFKPGEKGLAVRLSKRSAHIIKTNDRDGSRYVANEILLRLKQGITLSEFQALLRRIKGMVAEGNVATCVYRIRLPENTDVPSLIKSLVTEPGIAKTEPNYAYPIEAPYRPVNPDISSVSPAVSFTAVPGSSAPVAIIDTGLMDESALQGYVLASLDAINPDDEISDPLGHGTQMALIAAGVVKPQGVSESIESYNPIIPIRAFDDNGFISNFDIMRGIDFALKHGARVINLSWGSETRSDFLEDNLNYAVSKGLIVVASAGNEPTGKPVYPAAYSSVIGVGALGPDGKKWEKSNYGDFVIIQAPGFASLPVGYKGYPGTYAGTSISAAFTANLIANYLSENPNANIKEVLNALGER